MQERTVSSHPCVSPFISFLSILWYSEYKFFACLDKFIPTCFIIFDVIVNGFLSFNSVFLLYLEYSVQFSSVTLMCSTLCDNIDCGMPGVPVHRQCPRSAHTHVHQVGDAIQPPHPLWSLLLLPPVFPSIRVFSSESVLYIRWPK